MAIVAIIILVILVVSVVPQMWIRRVLARHSADRPEFPGTGGEFARHILNEMRLHDVGVQESDLGDHYDPNEKMVRLSAKHYRGKSLAAVVVAAHEVGHAIQDASGYPPFHARTQMAKNAGWMQAVAQAFLFAAPILLIIAKSPAILLVQVVAIGFIALLTILMHVVTLPVEFDASFKRALPILAAGRYIPDADLPAARSILRAAAYTYVAAAAMSVINVFRWLRFPRL